MCFATDSSTWPTAIIITREMNFHGCFLVICFDVFPLLLPLLPSGSFLMKLTTKMHLRCCSAFSCRPKKNLSKFNTICFTF